MCESPLPLPPQVCIEKCAASQDLRGRMVMKHNLRGRGGGLWDLLAHGVSPALNPCKFFTPSLFILSLPEGWDTPHPLFSADASSPGVHLPCAVAVTRWQHSPPAGWRFYTRSTPNPSIPETPQSRRPPAGCLSLEVSLRRPSRSSGSVIVSHGAFPGCLARGQITGLSGFLMVWAGAAPAGHPAPPDTPHFLEGTRGRELARQQFQTATRVSASS